MIDIPGDEAPPLVQLLPLSSEAGAYRVPVAHVATLLDAAEELGLASFAIDLDGCGDEATMLARMAEALAFPEWFGHNLDALADCLSDLEWLGEAGGYLLLFENSEALRDAAPEAFAHLVGIIDDVAQAWHAHQVPFWGFIAEVDGGG